MKCWAKRSTLAALAAIGAAGAVTPALAGGETIYVTIVNDTVDFGGAQRVADLPGPDGQISLREAIAAANNEPGPQTVGFQIPQSQWWLYSDRALVKSYSNPFHITGDDLTIDCTTQTAFTGDTNPDGSEVAFWGEHPNALGAPMFYVQASDCTFIGFGVVHRRGTGITLADGENNRVIGCDISGPLYAAVEINSHNNIIGGTGPGEANSLSSGNDGVRIRPYFNGPIPSGNRVIGNYLTGSATGASVIGDGNTIGGDTPAEGNVMNGAGTFGEHGYPSGAQLRINGNGNVIRHNKVGVNADGFAVSNTAAIGIEVVEGDENVIEDNIIGGIIGTQGVQAGITLREGANLNVIRRNFIGENPDGQSIANNNGIVVYRLAATLPLPNDNLITRNLIWRNTNIGIQVGGNAQGIHITENSIDANGGLGIALLAGSNGDQPAPYLLSAARNDTATIVQGEFTAQPNRAYRLEFFASPTGDASGMGEGRNFLGAAEVLTDGDGAIEFNETLPVAAPADWIVASTAIDTTNNNTSAFSNFRQIGDAGSTGEPVTLDSFQIVFGSLIGGDIFALRESDNAFVRTRSSFGFSALEPNLMEMRIECTSPMESPDFFDLVFEGRTNHPNGTAKYRFRKWSNSSFVNVGEHTLGSTVTESTIDDIANDGFVRATDGRVTLSVKHVVPAVFSAQGFDSFLDRIGLVVH